MIDCSEMTAGEVFRFDPPYDGYAMLADDGALWIPLFVVDSDRQGEGLGAAFLDALPTDRDIIIPSVINPVFRDMLERRGFHRAIADVGVDVIEVMVRGPGVESELVPVEA